MTDFKFGRDDGQWNQTVDQQGIVGNGARLQQCRGSWVRQSPGPQEDYGEIEPLVTLAL